MANQDVSPPASASIARVTRRVVIGQMLFSTGNVLSTGGFLYYFANEFRPSAALFALLQVAPEVAESLGVFARPVVDTFGGRKRAWMALLIIGRLAALVIPAMAFPALRPEGVDPFWIIVTSVAVWYACQGLSFVAYLSWLSDLAPERQWGRFFAARQMSTIVVSLIVPVAAAMTRERWLKQLPDGARDWSFAAIFIAGGVLALGSIVPLWRLPDVPRRTASSSLQSWSLLPRILADRSLRRVLAGSWWLALAQGLSQAAIFKFQVEVLHVPLSRYYVLSSVMLVLQLPLAVLAGRMSDRYGDRRPLMLALWTVSPALLFLMSATPQTWWLLFGAYALWGLFGIINVCQQNLVLRLAPATDNTLQLGLFRQVGGLLAGLAGLCGGLWLDDLLLDSASVNIAGLVLGPFQIVFAASLLGRITAPLWFLGVRESGRSGCA
ncbi:MAG: MFS transporter [Planctomycetaceae bacterium]|nr:MFS transporter [Planctomycetaceae bacterium]